MKLSPFALALVVSASAQAAGTQYICKELQGDETRTVVLTQVGSRKIVEGKKEPFVLELYKTGQKTPLLVAEGTVETEDVMFNFTSADKRTVFGIYLDELDQSYLTLKGQKTSYFDCK